MSIEWKVSGLPESPGKGWRYTREIRQVVKGEFFCDTFDLRIREWGAEKRSESIYPIVERIRPKRIVLEQVLSLGDVRDQHLYFDRDRFLPMGEVPSCGWRKAVEDELVWRRMPEEKEEDEG